VLPQTLTLCDNYFFGREESPKPASVNKTEGHSSLKGKLKFQPKVVAVYGTSRNNEASECKYKYDSK
jgi:hypothetical protein